MFFVGQKVVCIDASPCPFWGELTLVKNRIYTIEETLYAISARDFENCLCLVLVEDKGPAEAYVAVRFRPVVEKKTDISIFTAMLHTTKEDA